MSDLLSSLLLSLATLLAGYELLRHSEPRVTVCRCGDLVRSPHGLPVQCPSCRHWLIA
jgi:Zn finger protein HypA/HybF involved in hydrogenase expression